jgi:outer membrane receptor protein involved in Fe transport
MHSTGRVEERPMIAPLLAALLLAVLGPHLDVVDERGTPVAHATAVFRSASGATAGATSDAAGNLAAPADFDAVSVTVTAAGFDSATITLPATSAAIVLHAQSTVIGRVSVATGSSRNLHRLAVPAATLDTTAIATSPAFATDSLLRALPGFDFVRSNSAFTAYGNLRVSFSGSGEDRGLVLADDVPAQDGFGGQVNWLAYPPGSLDSVELLRGPGAALYGANAIGGVLQLRSFGPGADWRAMPAGSIELQDGTPHRTNATFNYRFTVAPNLTAAVTTQTGHQAYSDFPPGYTSPIDREATSTSSATRAQMRYTFGHSALTAGGLFANDEQFEGRPSYTFARDLTQADLHFLTSTPAATLSVVAYNRDTNITNTDDLAPTTPGALRYIQQIPTRESGVAGSWFFTQGNNEIALRADEKFVTGVSTQTGPTGALQSQGSGKQQYAGLALEDTYEAGRMQVIAGLRGDLVATSDTALRTLTSLTAPQPRTDRVLSPRLAARYDVTKGIALRASTGGGFREPFLNELVRGYRIGNISYNPNPNLIPERSANYGVGADALLGAGRLSLDYANTRVTNAIEFVTSPTSPTTQTRSNVGRTQTDSTTLTYATRVARCTRLRAYLTSQYARITNGPVYDLGNRLQYVPSRSGDVAVDSGSGAFGYGADIGYAGVTFADDRNTQILPAAIILGAHITRPLGQGAALTLEASNLSGTRYLSSPDRYGPPPSIGLRLRFGLGPQGPDSGTPGCP